jgi:NADPH:quinone reductase-like Zn-dependent oxidoreductase
MRAIIRTEYGTPEVLQVREIEKPIPKDTEVRVQVHAASINYGDWGLLTGKPFFLRLTEGGIREPKIEILGGDVAGRVEAAGSNARQFQPGDEVYGELSSCGQGSFAEYVCATEEKFVLKPANISFEEAAAVPMAAVVALQGLRDEGHIRPGQKVLINGASGGVGTFAVQIAKVFGAEVTAVCSTMNQDMARSLGADHVIDYTQEDFTKSGQRYDLILAANGFHPISDYRRALRPQGVYVCSGGSLKQIFQSMLLGPLMSRSGGNQMGNLLYRQNAEDLVFMNQLLESGKVVPVIDRSFPLNETPEAFRYFGKGHARGKVVIPVEHSDGAALRDVSMTHAQAKPGEDS